MITCTFKSKSLWKVARRTMVTSKDPRVVYRARHDEGMS